MAAPEQLRHAYKFEGEGGSYTFPYRQYEYAPSQGFRPTLQQGIGADYAHDHMGTNRWAKAVGVEPVRFLLADAPPAELDAEYEQLCGVLINSGRGQLWTTNGDGSDLRWSWAKLGERPGYMSATRFWGYTAVTLRFQRFSDWRSAQAVATTGLGGLLAPVTLNSNPEDFTLTNLGNAQVKDLVMRIRSSSATGFTNPALENTQNGNRWSSTRDATSSNSELLVDAKRYRVAYSNDDGASYSPDWSLFTVGSAPFPQVHFMALDPGANLMRYSQTGTPNAQLEYSYYHTWH